MTKRKIVSGLLSLIIALTFLTTGIMAASASPKTDSVKNKGKKKTTVVVEEVDYDAEDREVSFEFQGEVKWKKTKVTIRNSKGKNMVRKIVEKDDDEIEVSVKKLSPGEKYIYKITGVARKGSKKYRTVKGSFTP